MVHLFRSEYFDGNSPFLFLTNWFIALKTKISKGIKNGKSHYYWLAHFNRKMSFHIPRVFQPISDRSVWHNGKHPRSAGVQECRSAGVQE